jgi:cytochrome c biogenesis protein CcmG, thiol:disulfide interchange protein DsbE
MDSCNKPSDPPCHPERSERSERSRRTAANAPSVGAKRRSRGAATIAAAALTLLTACSSASNSSTNAANQGDQTPQHAHVGSPAPDWTEPKAGGGTLELSSLKGKAVYLNFFATWCPPCNEEAPAINALQQKYASQGLQVVGVDVLENAGAAQKFRDEHKLVYPALADSGTLRDEYNINGLPVHVFIDRTGIVRNVVVGELSPAEMDENVQKLLH